MPILFSTPFILFFCARAPRARLSETPWLTLQRIRDFGGVKYSTDAVMVFIRSQKLRSCLRYYKLPLHCIAQYTDQTNTLLYSPGTTLQFRTLFHLFFTASKQCADRGSHRYAKFTAWYDRQCCQAAHKREAILSTVVITLFLRVHQNCICVVTFIFVKILLFTHILEQLER